MTATAAASGARVDRFTKQALVTDRSDAHLVNPWGLAASREGPWWVANEGRSTSTLYSSEGRKQALTVTVPGGPTGVVFNGGRGFVVRGNGASGAGAIHLRVRGRDDPGLDADGPTRLVEAGRGRRRHRRVRRAVPRASRSRTGGCTRRTSTTTASSSSTRTGAGWTRPGAFVDRAKPDWYAPFGIQAIGDRIFVTYAYRAPVNGNDAPHGGYVDEFDLDGRLLAHVGRTDELRRAVGRRARAARDSAASAAISSSRTSAAAGSTPTGGSATAGRSGAGCR